MCNAAKEKYLRFGTIQHRPRLQIVSPYWGCQAAPEIVGISVTSWEGRYARTP